MDTRLPRNTATKSPMLSSKSPIISEKYKSGCAWGLFHFFDFRHGKLISDKKQTNRLSKGLGHSKDHRKASKSSKKSDRNTISKNSASGNRKHDHQTELNVRVNMNEAIEAFVNQRLSNRSTDFIDALEILNSNKDLFVKLLQDPNSLLVKHIQDLRTKETKPPSSSEAKTSSQSKHLNTIVVLKAGKQKSHYSYNKKEKGVSPTFLPFEHIKRKSKPLNDDGMQNSNTNQRTEDAFNIFGKSEYFDSSKSNGDFRDSPSREQTSYSSKEVYSSSPLRIRRVEDSDSTIDKTKQLSSLSVLEQSFVEDDTCSPSTISLGDIEELHESSVDKQGSLSKCIRTILQKSGLNWDELFTKWHISDQMLDSSVFDDVKVWPNKSCSIDHRLLFDYIDEVLLEMNRCFLRCSPCISLLNPRPRPALLSKDMVHEVLRHVDWLLLSELPQPTLQQLVENDLARSRTWMEIGLDTEELVTELADSIVEDLVTDNICSMFFGT